MDRSVEITSTRSTSLFLKYPQQEGDLSFGQGYLATLTLEEIVRGIAHRDLRDG